MTRKLKLTAIGNSVGVILPKELLERLRVGRGDELHVLETPNGIELTPYDEEFAEEELEDEDDDESGEEYDEDEEYEDAYEEAEDEDKDEDAYEYVEDEDEQRERVR